MKMDNFFQMAILNVDLWCASHLFSNDFLDFMKNLEKDSSPDTSKPLWVKHRKKNVSRTVAYLGNARKDAKQTDMRLSCATVEHEN